ncbi:MAG: CobW family GTP-binding protein [Pseudomonadota bacterium]
MTTPVTVIGGYLGAGKTTLINRLLRHADGMRIAVLVNEFGALPIDEDMIEQTGDTVIAIAGGCICCAFGDNLIGALNDLAQIDPAPDHIVIEASGVAIPASLAATITLLPAFGLSGVVVLADAETVQRMADDPYLGDTILRQLADADLVVLTKADLVSDDQRHAVAGWLKGVCGHANIILARNGALPNALVLGPQPRDTPPRPLPHGDSAFESVVLTPHSPTDPAQLAKALAKDGNGVVRAKGFVVDAAGQRHAIQIVGARWDVSPAPTAGASGVVCIGLAGQLRRDSLNALVERQQA